MSASPAWSRVRRAIDLQYAHKQRASSIKWICINAALLLVFALDLWFACPGYRSALHYAEAALACAAAASAARHALRLLEARAPPVAAPAPAPAPAAAAPREDAASLSPARSWRGSPPAPAPAAPAPAPSPPPAPRALADRLIADRADLDRYLSAIADDDEPSWSEAAAGAVAGAPPAYHVSPLRAEPAPEARAAPGSGAGGGGGEGWRRVRVEPARLARFDLNLRRWLHATVLERLARELDAADAALAAAGLEARTGAASAARLAALAAAAPAPLARRLRALLPFLRPFADQAYAVRRVRELARAATLPACRWSGGGAGWDAARCPPDAELALRLLAAYLDSVAPAGAGAGSGAGAGAFSAAHLSEAPAPPPRAPGALVLHRAAPAHYAVVVGRDVLEPAPGRGNLPAALLLFLAAAARREPPALLRLHLGPAGLNMLWMLER